MMRNFTPLIAALLLALPGLTAAQETTTEEAAPVEETAPAEQAPAQDAPADDADADAGATETANGEPALGQQYIREEFGDWFLRCLRTEDPAEDPCQMYQLLLDEQENPVAEITVFPVNNASQAVAGSTVVAPLETLLTENVRLSVDGGQVRQYPFSFCTTAGCVSRIGFTQPEIDQFKRGAVASLVIVPAGNPEVTVDLSLSLSGFTAAWNAVLAN